MELDNRRVFMTMGLFALFLVSMIVSQYYNAMNNAALGKKRKAEYGSRHFSGKVTGYKVYRYMNKNYYRICILLDTPATRPLHIYDDDDAIGIENNMATFSAGYLNSVLGPADSVAVNEEGSDKIFFYYRGHAFEKKDFEFDKMGLAQNDLKGCN